MSQKKLPEKINSLDIFSLGVELEPIDYKEMNISNDKNVIIGGNLTKENNDKITDYIKQAKEMLIQQQKQQQPFYTEDKNFNKSKTKEKIQSNDKYVIPTEVRDKIPSETKDEPKIYTELHDKNASKITQEVSKLEERINDPDFIPHSRNIQESSFMQRGGNPLPLTHANMERYMNVVTGEPTQDFKDWARRNDRAIFIYKIDRSYSIDTIPVSVLVGSRGAIFRYYRKIRQMTDHAERRQPDVEPRLTAPFNTLYYETFHHTDNEFMIKLGENGLLINTRHNHEATNNRNVQQMLQNQPGIVRSGDILFFSKMNDVDKRRIKRRINDDGKFIQLRDDSRTENILDLKEEIFPICYSERHYKYLNSISRHIRAPDLNHLPRLDYLNDKYDIIRNNLENFDGTVLNQHLGELYRNYLLGLKVRVDTIYNYYTRLNNHVNGVGGVGGVINDPNFDEYKRAVCAPPNYTSYLEIDDSEYDQTNKDRYCRITLNNPYPPYQRDPDHQYCMKDNEPWTNRPRHNRRSYTYNCERKIGEQYIWAIKEMSMIYSRCPVSVNIPMSLEQQQNEISSGVHRDLYATLDHLLRQGNNAVYTVGRRKRTSPGYQSTINFFRSIPDQEYNDTRTYRYGAFVYNNIYNRRGPFYDRFARHSTLYRASSHDIFPFDAQGARHRVFTDTAFSSTSINLDNTIRPAFLDNNGFLYVIKLAKDVPYIPMGRPQQGSDISRTCYPNEAEILLPPGCRYTLYDTRVRKLRNGDEGQVITFTIYLVYVEYLNSIDYIGQCNKYIDERSPFSDNTRQGPVNNLFKNEIRISYDPPLAGQNHYPTENRRGALQNFWRDYNPGTTIQGGGNITNNASQQKNDVKELLQPGTRVKPGNFSKILSK